jgi:hypothetical protein
MMFACVSSRCGGMMLYFVGLAAVEHALLFWSLWSRQDNETFDCWVVNDLSLIIS